MADGGKTNGPYPMLILIAGGIQSLPELPSQEIVDIEPLTDVVAQRQH